MKKKIEHFTDLEVWKKAHQLFIDIMRDLEALPRSRVNLILTDQLTRSAGAISANIAEGFHSRSLKQYLSFLDIGRRTVYETENWLYKLRDLDALESGILKQRLDRCREIGRMLSGLIRSLEQKRNDKT